MIFLLIGLVLYSDISKMSFVQRLLPLRPSSAGCGPRLRYLPQAGWKAGSRLKAFANSSLRLLLVRVHPPRGLAHLVVRVAEVERGGGALRVGGVGLLELGARRGEAAPLERGEAGVDRRIVASALRRGGGRPFAGAPAAAGGAWGASTADSRSAESSMRPPLMGLNPV